MAAKSLTQGLQPLAVCIRFFVVTVDIRRVCCKGRRSDPGRIRLALRCLWPLVSSGLSFTLWSRFLLLVSAAHHTHTHTCFVEQMVYRVLLWLVAMQPVSCRLSPHQPYLTRTTFLLNQAGVFAVASPSWKSL